MTTNWRGSDSQSVAEPPAARKDVGAGPNKRGDHRRSRTMGRIKHAVGRAANPHEAHQAGRHMVQPYERRSAVHERIEGGRVGSADRHVRQFQ